MKIKAVLKRIWPIIRDLLIAALVKKGTDKTPKDESPK